LVGRHVTVIVATAGGGTPASLAAKAATTMIPILKWCRSRETRSRRQPQSARR
jgi:hypothetical protein